MTFCNHRLAYRQVALLLLLLAISSTWTYAAEPTFPSLTGRVVDKANLVSPQVEQTINQQLGAHEAATGNQIVLVTLDSLQGYPIEDFGYQLGRHWRIGQKDKNNGALLIVAPNERKMRIEVGYGLEGQLTDAISANIIQTVITPAFKQGEFEQGIQQGITAIIEAVGGQYKLRDDPSRTESDTPFPLIIFIVIFIIFSAFGGGGGRRRGRHSRYYGGYGGYSGGGFGGGGFSGGGGSFGGGGASGGW